MKANVKILSYFVGRLITILLGTQMLLILNMLLYNWRFSFNKVVEKFHLDE